MSEPIKCFHCCHPGLIMDGIDVKEITNSMGQHYFKATSKIGYIFGYEVEGELTGIGTTRDMALARLASEREKLYESLWA